jgi:hypothetical protein
MRARRILIAMSSLAFVAAGLTMAPSASADSVQVQSYQRASQSEACAAQTGETPWETAWGTDASWHPTWEQWANGGTGGWTCTRSIIWATSTPPRGCVQTALDSIDGPQWMNFGSADFTAPDAIMFSDAGCSVATGQSSFHVVWATDGTAAGAICEALLSGSYARSDVNGPPNIYRCILN